MSKDQDKKRPEEMANFFDSRADGYDDHMRRNVESFAEFYGAVSAPFPKTNAEVAILDLGCGTGLELQGILEKAPNARVTCVDLSEGMLDDLKRKYSAYTDQIRPVQASYLTLQLGEGIYDCVVSVMSVHHLLHDAKRRLYERIRSALKPGGIYVEGDYVVTKEEEQDLMERYRKIVAEHGEPSDGYFHIDIPFTAETQVELLSAAGFTSVAMTWHKGAAAVLVATR